MRELEFPRLDRRRAHIAACGFSEVQSAGLVVIIHRYVIGLDVVYDGQRFPHGHGSSLTHGLGLFKGVVDGVHTNFSVVLSRIFQREYDTTD